MTAKVSLWRIARRPSSAVGVLTFTFASACTWFTDFKQQPKIDPWEATGDSLPARGNPQGSVPIFGTMAPEFLYARIAPPPAPGVLSPLDAMSALVNPVAPDSASVRRGRIEYQVNCAVCHGPLGMGNGPAVPYGLFPPQLGPGSAAATTRSDGYIFGVIRNGRGTMPPYNRIEESDRWDIVNYVRSLQGKLAIAADSSHGRPGETGDKLPGASTMGPTRPAPYYHLLGAQAGAREALGAAAASPAAPSVQIPTKPVKPPVQPPAQPEVKR